VLYDRIGCVNSDLAKAVMELGGETNTVHIAPAFLPIEMPDVQLPAGIESWLQSRSPVVSATMFFRPEYGFEILIAAVSRLKQIYPNIGCLVMGSGSDRAEAGASIEECGLGNIVYLAGDLDHELCLAVMARSTAFVRPTFRDGDSISVREAQALGVPVIASDIGTRPVGVTLFSAGDVGGLVNAMASVFSTAAAGTK
jgi:glycosyltransferase involved in cell wall biosynthesis